MAFTRALRLIALPIVAVSAIAPLTAVAADMSISEMYYPSSIERPITPNIAAIPVIAAVVLKKPYRLAWQRALQAQEEQYIAQIQGLGIDEVETGSITSTGP